MGAVCERGNLWLAYERVTRNKGAAGVDGIGVAEFKSHLQRHWPTIKAKLLAGEYIPSPVRRVDIPKPQGGVRTLGIPTLTDRLIQQALHQVLSPIFEPTFSASSYGFRPGRSAHQAVLAAQRYVAEGRRMVVDLDLEKFFDRVNHDLLMGKLAQRIDDRRVLQLIRRYLEAGMMAEGVTSPRTEGAPQGGPLSPLLSNILLTDLDRELERRGHAFCRYADDCNIYVRSRQAGERVLASLTRFLTQRLKLTVNVAKSAVAHPWERKFLGYSLTWHKAPETTDCAEQPATAARSHPCSAQGRERAAPGPHDSGTQSGTARLGGLLQADRGQAGAGGTGRLAQAQAALHPVAAVETAVHTGA
jgi:RNA-directed DNA polymerase